MYGHPGDYSILDGSTVNASHGHDVIGDLYGDVSGENVSKVVGLLLVGAIGTLIALRLGGFRFSFGVGVGAGS